MHTASVRLYEGQGKHLAAWFTSQVITVVGVATAGHMCAQGAAGHRQFASAAAVGISATVDHLPLLPPPLLGPGGQGHTC